MSSGPVPLTPGSGVMLTTSPSSMLNDELLRTAEALRTQAHDALGLGSRGAGGDAGRTEKPLAEELTLVQYEQELSASKRMHEVERQSLRSQVRSAEAARAAALQALAAAEDRQHDAIRQLQASDAGELRVQHEALVERMHEVEGRLSELAAVAARAESQQKAAAAKASMLEGQLASSQSTCLRMHAELVRREESECAVLLSMHEPGRHENNGAQKRWGGEIDGVSSSATGTSAEASPAIADATRGLGELHVGVMALASELARLDGPVHQEGALERALAEATREKDAAVEAALSERERELTAEATRAAAALGDVAKLRAEAAVASERADEQTATILSLQAELVALQERLGTSKARLAAAEQQLSVANEQLARSEAGRLNAASDAEAARHSAQVAEEARAAAQREFNQQSVALDNLRSAQADLHTQLAAKESELSVARLEGGQRALEAGHAREEAEVAKSEMTQAIETLKHESQAVVEKLQQEVACSKGEAARARDGELRATKAEADGQAALAAAKAAAEHDASLAAEALLAQRHAEERCAVLEAKLHEGLREAQEAVELYRRQSASAEEAAARAARQAEETTKAAAVHEAASRSLREELSDNARALAAARVELEQMRGEEQEAVKIRDQARLVASAAKAEAEAARATAEAAKAKLGVAQSHAGEQLAKLAARTDEMTLRADAAIANAQRRALKSDADGEEMRMRCARAEREAAESKTKEHAASQALAVCKEALEETQARLRRAETEASAAIEQLREGYEARCTEAEKKQQEAEARAEALAAQLAAPRYDRECVASEATAPQAHADHAQGASPADIEQPQQIDESIEEKLEPARGYEAMLSSPRALASIAKAADGPVGADAASPLALNDAALPLTKRVILEPTLGLLEDNVTWSAQYAPPPVQPQMEDASAQAAPQAMGVDDDDHGPASALLKGVIEEQDVLLDRWKPSQDIRHEAAFRSAPGGNLDIEAARLAGGYFGSAGISYAQQPGWGTAAASVAAAAVAAKLEEYRSQRPSTSVTQRPTTTPELAMPGSAHRGLHDDTFNGTEGLPDDSVVIARRVSKDSSGKRLEASRVEVLWGSPFPGDELSPSWRTAPSSKRASNGMDDLSSRHASGFADTLPSNGTPALQREPATPTMSSLSFSAVMKEVTSPERSESGFVDYTNRTTSAAITASLPVSPSMIAPSPPAAPLS